MVTGAARGTGRAIALRLAAEGCRVVLGDGIEEGLREAAARCRELAGDSWPVVSDLSSTASCEYLIESALQHWGRLDALVNGIAGEPLETGRASVEGLRRAEAAARATTAEAVRVMARAGGGAIVNLLPETGDARYSMLELTRSTAVEHGAARIRCNAVAPGLVNSDGNLDHLDEADLERLRAGRPLGRWGNPDEIAAAVVFLLSDDASFITGAELAVDGGAGALRAGLDATEPRLL